MMTSRRLKYIAAAAMLIDHAGHIFQPLLNPRVYVLMRLTGRLAMPVFCFLIAEGLYHTRDVKKYLLRLLVAALVSEIPFDLMVRVNMRPYTWENAFNFGYQNTVWTLFLGLLGIMLFDYFAAKGQPWVSLLSILACAAAAMLARADYGVYGVYFIFVFYRFRGYNREITVSFAIGVLLFCVSKYLSGLSASLNGLSSTDTLIYLGQMAALVPIFLYNGEKGGKSSQLFFYVFYPAHMLLLFFLGLCFVNI